MIVLKFGGTSVQTRESLQTLADIVVREQHNSPLVVASAVRGVTDSLLGLTRATGTKRSRILSHIRNVHERLIDDLWTFPSERRVHKWHILHTLRELSGALRPAGTYTDAYADGILAYGERLSCYLVSRVLASRGIRAVLMDASDLIVTDDRFGEANYLYAPTRKNVRKAVIPLLAQGIVPVVTGFIGATADHRITTLGRGGSDYTATILAQCLRATEVQIWTDVDGVFSGDPNVITCARRLHTISYEVAKMFAQSGAKVLHPKTINPTIRQKIPIRILNTMHPQCEGTRIGDGEKHVSGKAKIYGIAHSRIGDDSMLFSIIGEHLESDRLTALVTKIFFEYPNLNIRLARKNSRRIQFVVSSSINYFANLLHDRIINSYE